ncbi:7-cyano-7-deazaguanine synthase [Rhizobium sp. BR 317]|uniref:7-cyano-7-deazaguanine synthase n=1 Tax=Rhizobium sp. BR 317 TaxID=3040015 RepID=UPI0039BF6993
MKLDFQNHKSLVIALSGGIDSYVCTYAALKQGIRVSGFHAITARPVAKMERSSAKWLANSKNFYLEITDFRQMLETQVGYLSFEAIALDELDTDREFGDGGGVSVTAFTTILSCMIYYAHIAGKDGVVVGMTKEQASGRDAIGAFSDLESSINKLNPKANSAPNILAPLRSLSKQEIIKLGFDLKVPFEKTWSCTSPQQTVRHCGKCAGCQARRNGFNASGIDDPTDYHD